MDIELIQSLRVEALKYNAIQSLLLLVCLLLVRRSESKWLAVYVFLSLLTSGGILIEYFLKVGLLPPPYDDFFLPVINGLEPAVFAYYVFRLLNRRIGWIKMLWLIPGVLFLVFLLRYNLTHERGYTPFVVGVQQVHIVFSLLFELWLVIYIHRAVRKDSGGVISKKNKIQLYWFVIFLYFCLLQWGLNLFTILYINSSGPFDLLHFAEMLACINSFVNAFLILILTYIAIRLPYVFNSLNEWNLLTTEERILEVVLPEQHKTDSSSSNVLSEKERETLLARVDHALLIEKIYLQHDLTLNRLANDFAVSGRVLSQLISRQYQKSLIELVNYYRVEHACLLLKDSAHRQETMYAIAIDSGFNSESTFYRVFKQEKGITPKQYREQK